MAVKKNNKTCLVCGARFTFCPNCLEFKTQPRWMSLFDNESCHEVFNIVSEYNQGVITPEVALEKLVALDLKDISHFNQKIQDVVNKILEPLREKEEKEKEAEGAIEDGTYVKPPKKMRKRIVDSD